MMKRLFFISITALVLSLTHFSYAEDLEAPGKETKTDKAEEVGTTEKKKTVSLGDIVVTATKTEKEAATAPGSISVVTQKDIEKRNIQSIDQALNTLSGVFGSRTRVMDYSSQVTMRGIPYGGGRSLVLVDGINLNDPMLGGLYGFVGLAPESVDRIEVVKGPSSSLYGGQAMGGVVNIIGKMPEKREFTVTNGYGSSWERGEAADDLKRHYVSYGDNYKDKLSVFMSYGIKETNGYSTIYNIQRAQPTAGISGWFNTTDTSGNPRYLVGDKGDTEWQEDNVTFKAGYDFSNTSKIKLSFYRTCFETHYDNPHTYLKDAAGNPVWSYGSVSQPSFLNYHDMYREQNFYNMSYETELSMIKSKISFSYVDSIFGAGVPGSSSTSAGGPGTEWENPFDKYYNVDFQFTAPISERHLLTFGGFYGYNNGQMDEYSRLNWRDEGSRTGLTYRSKGKDRTYSLFMQDEIMILDSFTAYVGFREDWWETFDGYVYQAGATGYPKNYDSSNKTSFSPKVALVYRPFEETTFRTSAGKAFRAPTIVELYRTWTAPAGITYAGNPNLKPETTKSWDAGAEQGLWKGARIKATYFENYMEDFIYRAMSTSTLYKNENVGKAESKGVELEAEQHFGNLLRFFTNFTYTNSEVTENRAKPGIVGKQLTMLPERMFNIGADLTKGGFSISLIGRYVSKIYRNDDNSDRVENVYYSYDPYFITDTKISYNINRFGTISLSVDNILDEDYFYSDKAPGRSWFGEVTLRF